MPVTIGSQTDVPSTGDPIVSPWYQDTARKLVHTFASNAARDAWTTRPEGALAYSQDTNLLHQWDGSAWRVVVRSETATTWAATHTWGSAPSGVGSGVQVLADGRVLSTIDGAGLSASGNLTLTRRGSTGTPGGASSPYVRFLRSASTGTPTDGELGSITINAGITGVTYATTSDPRIKVRSGDIADAADRVRQLGAAAFRGHLLHADTGEPVGDERDLLSSHDIEDVAAYAVTGERDAVDDNGNPMYQQVAYGELVPLLVAALADALERIATLEGTV